MTVYPGNTFSNIEDIFINLFKEYNLKILKLNEIKKKQGYTKCYSYEINGLRYKSKKKILLSNQYHNRIAYDLRKAGFKVISAKFSTRKYQKIFKKEFLIQVTQ